MFTEIWWKTLVFLLLLLLLLFDGLGSEGASVVWNSVHTCTMHSVKDKQEIVAITRGSQ